MGIISFLAFTLCVGVISWYATRNTNEQSSDGYFLGGRSLTAPVIAGSLLLTNLSTEQIVGLNGSAYESGLSVMAWETLAAITMVVTAMFLLPRYLKGGIITVPGFLAERFDIQTKTFASALFLTGYVVVLLPVILYSGSVAISGMFDIPELLQVSETTALWICVWGIGIIGSIYAVFGGLKAVAVSDTINAVGLLIGGIMIPFFGLSLIGDGSVLDGIHVLTDAHPDKFNSIGSESDPVPFHTLFTGMMLVQLFYWGTNQFIVQRALAATSDKEARIGIIAAGFLKLLIPFFAIATGVAAYYLFQNAAEFKGQQIDPDTAFPVLVNTLISPLGMGLVGLIAAGLIGAILSSIDSMMNSAATIITVDIYQRYIKPTASDEEMIRMGRYIIVTLMAAAALMAIYVINPNSEANFFLTIADYSNYLTPGLLVAFILGIFWKRGTTNAAFVAILAGVAFSYIVPAVYNSNMSRTEYDLALSQEQDLGSVVASMQIKDFNGLDDVQKMTIEELETHLKKKVRPQITPLLQAFGPKLNFFHRVIFVIGLTAILYVIISYFEQPDPEKSRITWTDLGGHDPAQVKALGYTILLSVAIYAALGWLMASGSLSQVLAGVLAAGWTMAAYLLQVLRSASSDLKIRSPLQRILHDERTLAGILAATAMFMMYYFY